MGGWLGAGDDPAALAPMLVLVKDFVLLVCDALEELGCSTAPLQVGLPHVIQRQGCCSCRHVPACAHCSVDGLRAQSSQPAVCGYAAPLPDHHLLHPACPFSLPPANASGTPCCNTSAPALRSLRFCLSVFP